MVAGSGGGLQRYTSVTLTVVAAPTFAIGASPSSLTIAQGNQGFSTDHHIRVLRIQQLHQSLGFRRPVGNHPEFEPHYDFRARLRQLNADRDGGQEHGHRELSDHGDRQRRRRAAKYHGQP